MNEEIIYRQLNEREIEPSLFRDFERRQVVNLCWRRMNGRWVIRKDPFVDQWSAEDYEFLIQCLRRTVKFGGVVYAAFKEGACKGFASAEGERIGESAEYVDLTSLHVSEEMRRQGIGRNLFFQSADWASAQGAEKLYISSHSAIETQAFYRSIGCVDAVYLHPEHVRQEPYDCQLEYVLRRG